MPFHQHKKIVICMLTRLFAYQPHLFAITKSCNYNHMRALYILWIKITLVSYIFLNALKNPAERLPLEEAGKSIKLERKWTQTLQTA